TAFYMGRQVLLVFFGKLRAEEPANRSIMWQPSWMMRIPLIILALLSFGIVYSINPFSTDKSWLLQGLATKLPAVPGNSLDYVKIATEAIDWHRVTTIVALGASLLGLLMAYGLYRPAGKRHQLYHTQPDYQNQIIAFFAQNWYLDRLYRAALVRPAVWLGGVGRWLDRRVVDGLLHSFTMLAVVAAHILAWLDHTLVDGIVRGGAASFSRLGNLVRSVQTGRIQTYLVASFLLFIALLYWLTQF
ncbi:MAG: hypothetical protein AAF223_09585, partial [Bacteroidota bacterium]